MNVLDALHTLPTQIDWSGRKPANGIAAGLRPDSDSRAATQGFAVDMARRLAQVPKNATATAEPGAVDEAGASVPAAATSDPQLAVEERAAEANDLAGSLERAVNFVRDNFGDQAATATMGLVYQHVGSGELTEEKLADGLLSGLKFIDRNFGVAAGDKVMAFFNGDVNNALNAFFDNGLSEQFYAASAGGGAGALPPALGQAVEEIGMQFGEDVAASVLDIIGQSVEEGGLKAASLRRGVVRAAEYLATQQPLNPTAAPMDVAEADVMLGAALAGAPTGPNGSAAYVSALPRGVALDMQV